MYYAYILFSKSSNIFYYGSTSNLEKRFIQHNSGISKSTKGHLPWLLVWYCVFPTQKQAEDFEKYLKSGSGKAFAYKRLVALAKDELLKDKRISRVSVALAKDT